MQPITDRRFLDSTRGQVVALLRAGPQTVEELAGRLDLTDNGVRAHLAALERDGIVRRCGSRRGEGAGKPAVLHELTPEAEALLSRAFAPVLGALMEELVAELPAEQRDALLSRVGRRLAAGALPSAGAGLDARLETAMGVLTALGGAASLEERDGVRVIRGLGCPLGAIVAHRPETCRVMEVLLAEILGHPVRQCCEHGERPRCCFEVRPAA